VELKVKGITCKVGIPRRRKEKLDLGFRDLGHWKETMIKITYKALRRSDQKSTYHLKDL